MKGWRFNKTAISGTGFFHFDNMDPFWNAGDPFRQLRADLVGVYHMATATRTAGFRWPRLQYFTGTMFRAKTALAWSLRIVIPNVVTIAFSRMQK